MSRSLYPEPPIKYRGYSSLYFTPERQIKSRLALMAYDRGELTLSPRRVVFTGIRVLVDCPNVTAVGVVFKAFPWGILLPFTALAALAVYQTAPVPFTWLYFLAIVLLAAFLHWREQWVEVVHCGPTGVAERAYLRQGGRFLRSGNAATRRLGDEIRRKVLTAEGTESAEPLR